MAETKKKTVIAVLVDRSGSMETIKNDTEGGLKSFLDEQKNSQANDEMILVTLAQFDSEYETVYESITVSEVPEYKLQPRGTTALVDSLYRLVSTVNEQVETAPEDEKPESIIIVTLTDGFENSSREFTSKALKGLVEAKTEDGWKFMFLGANIDAVATGAQYGFQAGLSITYAASSAGVRSSFSSASRVATVMRGGVGESGFLAEEREQALDASD